MAPFESVGYWGEPTSTIDWCERNYEVSFYIAEMCNTVSNLMMIIPPLWGMAEVLKQRFEKRFIFCHFLLLLVGLGSWAFHMTLLYEMQLFDELPMVWGTCVLVYCFIGNYGLFWYPGWIGPSHLSFSAYKLVISEVRATATRGKFSNVPLICFLAAFSSLFTAVYLLWPQPLLQHTSYGLLVLTSFGLEIRLINFQKCRVCRKLFVMSLSTYLLGFFLWNIDKIFCPNLQLLRNVLPSPVSPLTQLHAWWHCLAGYATYLQVLFCIHSNFDFHKDKRDTRKLELTQFGCSLRWSQNSKHCQ